jgi:DNA-binding transcriptional ArsR family regulator
VSKLLPLRPSIEHTPQSRSALVLGDEESTAVIESLSPETARRILSALADRPATASDVAERVDTSIQNAHYHLTNLRDANLVTDAGTWYSSKGTEMTVYALTSHRLELRIEAGDSAKSAPTSPPRTPTASSCNTADD